VRQPRLICGRAETRVRDCKYFKPERRLQAQRLQENTMQQVFFCARTLRASNATTHVAMRAIASLGRVADSESRILATKLFSCLTAEALICTCASRRFARIAWRRFGHRIALGWE
jgi:hypothetical protein